MESLKSTEADAKFVQWLIVYLAFLMKLFAIQQFCWVWNDGSQDSWKTT